MILHWWVKFIFEIRVLLEVRLNQYFSWYLILVEDLIPISNRIFFANVRNINHCVTYQIINCYILILAWNLYLIHHRSYRNIESLIPNRMLPCFIQNFSLIVLPLVGDNYKRIHLTECFCVFIQLSFFNSYRQGTILTE
jgi:hypothetical protein